MPSPDQVSKPDYERLTESQVRADIRYFQERLAQLDRAEDRLSRARRTMYEVLFRQRRQLLAALRDGRPEFWPEYDPVPLDDLPAT